MTLILGISAYHPDAAACVVRDGQVLAAVAEERLGPRIKHYCGFPSLAVRKVLQIAGAELRDVDYVALGRDHSANRAAKASFIVRHPVHSARSVVTHLARRRKVASLRQQIAEACDGRMDHCRFDVVPVEHHVAHLASSFYTSGFDTAAGFSYDASGDFVSGMYARCQGHEIRPVRRVFLPHSLGFFYTSICQYIGFDVFGEEYKVMGLAAFGEPAYMDLMRRMLHLKDSDYRLDPQFFEPMPGTDLQDIIDEKGRLCPPAMYSKRFKELLGPPRRRDETITQRDQDLARSAQQHFEDVVVEAVNWLHGRVGGENLVTAGGCALNGVCNARILRDTPFHRAHIHCAASDDGTAVGAALYVWNSLLKKDRSQPVEHASLGPEYSESEMAEALRDGGVAFDELEEAALLDQVAGLLAAGKIVGWYQGASEWGPRALGNRSILAHPGYPGMKDTLNAKIKRREAFRPFAPSVLADRVGEYFDQPVDSPFMMHVVGIRPRQRQCLSAVTHVDGTGRLHTVRRSQNRIYYDLIETFARRGGPPVLLNTSFNENEPIVDRPEQAVDCYLRTEMDALCMGPFLATKNGRGRTTA